MTSTTSLSTNRWYSMSTRLDYIPGSSIVPPDVFTISPSSLGKFFDEPHTWYREHVLGERSFDQTTSTCLGTIVHFCGEDFILSGQVDRTEIYRYLYSVVCPTNSPEFPSTEPEMLTVLQSYKHVSIDIQHILNQYRPMGNALLDYIRKLPKHAPLVSEQMVAAEVIPGFYIAGSCDLRQGSNLYDFKTTSALSAPSSISYGYRLQLLAYAYAFIKSGTPISTASIIWITTNQVNRISPDTGKPMKDYPATCSVSKSIIIDEQSLEFIESILKLVAETVQFVLANPDKAYITFRDYRLKLSEIPQIQFLRTPNVSS